MLLGALEAGGTKMVCVTGDEHGNVFTRESFPTLGSEETLQKIVDYFADKEIKALGIGSFGPLCLDADSPEFGNITTTPKPGWQNVPLKRALEDALKVPVGIDTDVNAAALSEALLGAGKGCRTVVYFTIGTGVGGGLYITGRLHHGLIHPEMGHMVMRPDKHDPCPEGFCPYHASCLEGMASGPAIEKRWGKKAEELPVDHPAWDIEAEYLSQMCVNTMTMLSPQRIVLGGGVMHQKHLFLKIHRRTLELLGGYIKDDFVLNNIESFIVPPALGDNAGAAGSLLLAAEVLK